MSSNRRKKKKHNRRVKCTERQVKKQCGRMKGSIMPYATERFKMRIDHWILQ